MKMKYELINKIALSYSDRMIIVLCYDIIGQ